MLAGLLFFSNSFLHGQLRPELRKRVEINDTLIAAKNFLFWETFPEAKLHFDKVIHIGNILYNEGKFGEAIEWYKSVLPYLLLFDAPTQDMYFNLYNEIAINYERTGNYEQSISYYLKALSNIEDDSTAHAKQAVLLTNIASSLIYIKDYKKATFYIDQAINIFKENNAIQQEGIALATKARIFTETGLYHKAIATYISAATKIDSLLARQDSGKKNAAAISLKSGILNNISDIYLKEKQPDSALFYLEKIKAYFPDLPLYIKATILVSHGEVYSQKNNYKAAAHYMEEGLKIAQNSGIKEIAIQAHKALSTLYGKQKQFQKAWQHEQQYVALNESIFATKKLHQINNLETKYYLAKKDKEITSKQLQIKEQKSRLREKNLWVGLTLLALFSCAVILLISRRNYRNKQKFFKEKLANVEKERKIMQIEATLKGEEKERVRIAKELHDGVVSEVLAMKLNLKSIEQEYTGLKYSGDYRNILLQSEEIAQRLRQTAHNLMPMNLGEQGLTASIKAFLNRINNNKIQFSFQHYGHLPVLKEEVEKIILFMVLELIQNIIKHSKASEALIQLNYFEEILSITIEDNGVGISENNQSKGMGLKNLRENIIVLNATLDIKSSEHTGTTVLIELPVKEHRA